MRLSPASATHRNHNPLFFNNPLNQPTHHHALPNQLANHQR